MIKYIALAAFAFTSPIMAQETADAKPECNQTSCGKKDGSKQKKRDGKRHGKGKRGQGHKQGQGQGQGQNGGQQGAGTENTPAEA